jgi:tetratricopeptide (TPR) repeat protein
MHLLNLVAVSAVALGLVFAPPSARAEEPPAIPEEPQLELYGELPEPWREYLIRARAAERIADPLQRCLAFPDLPGNHWPEGHAAAHCRDHFGVQGPTLEKLGELVERGELARLEEIFDESLARHFSRADASEDIHGTFNYLLTGGGAEIDRITAAWLEQAPGSAYANLARGAYFNGAAWKARGAELASETPRENLRRMSGLVETAIPFFEKAVSINPRLIAAHTGMVDLGTLDSRPELEARAIALAEKVDPACVHLAKVRMRALQPRWGGSYEQMLAYARRISAHVPGRPYLAMHVGAPFADRGDRLVADDQFTRETLEILEIAIATGSDEGAFRDAANVAINLTEGQPDPIKGAAYLLQESRFRETTAWGARQIAWQLVGPEPEWSLKYSLRAVELEPGNTFANYLVGSGLGAVRRFDQAERAYRIAIEDPDYRQTSLREAAAMWLYGDAEAQEANAKRAGPYIDRLLREYPDDGRAWIMRLDHDMLMDRPVGIDLLRKVLAKLDRNDPAQADYAEMIEEAMEQGGTPATPR